MKNLNPFLLILIILAVNSSRGLGQSVTPVTPPRDDSSATIPTLLTVAEKSDYKATATYEEVMELCRALARDSNRVRLDWMGRTSRGRSVPLLVISNHPPEQPAELQGSEKLTILALGNIHAGEVCGKEALLMLARELSARQNADLLDQVVLLFAPIYNADGNQPVSTTNRPHQHGPDGGVGQRSNGQGLDLNRDHVKLESPESHGFAEALSQWNPAIVIDTHTTNGSYHRFTLTYDGPRNSAAPENHIRFMRDEFLPEVTQRMQRQSGYTSFYYGNFSQDHRQWVSYRALPRYGTQYVAVRGRLSILSEAYAYASYRDRVLATRQFVLDCVQLAAEKRASITSLLQSSREAWIDADLSGSRPSIGIQSEAVGLDRKFTALGYDESSRDQDAPRGTLPNIEQNYAVEYVGLERPTKFATRPAAYLVPAAWEQVIANLDRHGIRMQVLREDVELDVETYRIDKIEKAAKEFQRHYPVSLTATVESTSQLFEAGTVVVSTAQDLGRLVMLLLEPESQDGLATWNFFDASLNTGELFPVARLMNEQPLLTTPFDELKLDNLPSRQAITFDSVYGQERVNFRGSPQSGFRWLPDGEHYLLRREGDWWKIAAATGRATRFLDRSKLESALQSLPGIDDKQATQLVMQMDLNETGTAGLWKHKGDVYFGRIEDCTAVRATDAPQPDELPELSPDATQVAFVRGYDLYVARTDRKEERRLTFDGNSIVRHGKADWIYYEEIYNRDWKAYRWSPNSQSIAFMEYDDSQVRSFVVLDHMPHRADVENERYPKAGDPIPRVRLGVVDTDGGDVRWLKLGGYSSDNMILTRYGWLPDSQRLYVLIQDRAQRWMDVLIADAATGESTRLFRETTAAWVEDPGELHFLDDGSFLMRSDRDGWRHLYRFEANGKLKNAVTSGEWEVRRVHKVDRESEQVFFSGTRDSHIAEQLYRANLDGSGLTRLTKSAGWHRTSVAPGGKFVIDSHSNLQSPTTVTLLAGDGQPVRTLDANPVPELEKYRRGAVKLCQVPMRDGLELPAIMVLPPDFSSDATYPVWLMTYAGPHAPTVANSWSGGRTRSHMLAQLGLIAVHFDPRSASGRGPHSTWTAYRQLGVQELLDLDDAADWLASQPFVDGERIGVGGYSYGGFMASFAVTHSDKFSAGFAGAPVTDWRNYDAFYTERYMDTPQENPDGYEASSVVRAAENLRGKLLIVHGAMDDNVHLQNTLQLSDRLQAAGKEFDMMIYAKSRHGIGGQHFQRLRNEFIRESLLRP